MKKKVISILLAMAVAVPFLSACQTKDNTKETTQYVDTYENTERPMGSAEATDVNVGLIMGPPSMGLGYFMSENENGNTYNNYNFEVAGIDYSAVSASLNDGDYDIATVPSNVAAILYNNDATKEDVSVIDIGNLGLLYVLTTDSNINKLEDLKGKTVYSIGEGGPPEYTFDFLLDKYNLTNDVNFSFRPTPFEVVNLLQQEEGAVALLPQPFVEVAKMLVPGLREAIDVTAAWDKLNMDSGAESVTTVTVVRSEFLEEHEQAVIEFLKMAKKSTDYCLKNVDEAAEWTEKYETFLNPNIAKTAIPKCNICTVTGESMKEKLSGFLEIIYNSNPDAVGGKLPGDDFYYMPPEDID